MSSTHKREIIPQFNSPTSISVTSPHSTSLPLPTSTSLSGPHTPEALTRSEGCTENEVQAFSLEQSNISKASVSASHTLGSYESYESSCSTLPATQALHISHLAHPFAELPLVVDPTLTWHSRSSSSKGSTESIVSPGTANYHLYPAGNSTRVVATLDRNEFALCPTVNSSQPVATLPTRDSVTYSTPRSSHNNLATSSPRWSSAAPAQRLDGKIDTFEQELSPFTFSTQSSRPKDLAISSPIVSAADPAKRLDSKRHTFEEQLSPVTFFNQSSRHKDLATSSPRLSAADPAKRLDSKIHTVEEELVLDQKLLKGADHTSPPAKVSFSDDFTSDATFDTQGKNKSRRVSDNLVVRKPSKSSSKYSSTYLTRSISFNTSLSSRTASYATAEENRPAVPSFLGRHRSQDNITSLSRSVSFGTTRELRATALTSFKGRTYSLSLITPPPRSTSLGRIQESEPIHSARPPPPVSISSTGTLQGALPYNNPLYIDLSSRSAANPEFTKQAVFVPAVISRRRQQTTSEMASQGSSNPFDDPAAMATWQGVCPVRAESAMAQPDTAHSAGVSGGQAVFSPSAPADPAATTTTPSAAAATATPPRRRGLFRRVGRALRRLLRRG